MVPYPAETDFGGEIWSTVRLGSGCRDHPHVRKSGLGTLPILERWCVRTPNLPRSIFLTPVWKSSHYSLQERCCINEMAETSRFSSRTALELVHENVATHALRNPTGPGPLAKARGRWTASRRTDAIETSKFCELAGIENGQKAPTRSCRHYPCLRFRLESDRERISVRRLRA